MFDMNEGGTRFERVNGGFAKRIRKIIIVISCRYSAITAKRMQPMTAEK
jgi:hypothetical protein